MDRCEPPHNILPDGDAVVASVEESEARTQGSGPRRCQVRQLRNQVGTLEKRICSDFNRFVDSRLRRHQQKHGQFGDQGLSNKPEYSRGVNMG